MPRTLLEQQQGSISHLIVTTSHWYAPPRKQKNSEAGVKLQGGTAHSQFRIAAPSVTPPPGGKQ